tara:strand:+ start:2599 stop:2844 length:246 start_codon:yes stop_codon:yes gene_type:complete
MFEKLKQIKQLKELRDSLAQETVEVEKRGIKLILNGNLEVIEISLNQELDKQDQEGLLRDCMNEAVRKVQIKMAQNFKGMM